MSKRFTAIFIFGSIFLFIGLQHLSTHAADPTTQSLVQQGDMVYQGTFRLPQGDFGSPKYSGFNYGGTGLAYNQISDSLYLVGHDWYQLTAEVKIPEIVKSSKLTDLKTGTMLQNFVDATDGKLKLVNPSDPNSQKVSGQLVYENKLYLSVYSYYDGGVTQKLSHFVRPLDLSIKGQTNGPFKVGSRYTGFYSGYMTDIPLEWQSLFGGPAFTGGCCHAITSAHSQGPAVSVFDPADVGVKDPVPATEVLGYPFANPTLGTWSNRTSVNLYFNMTTGVTGMVFPGGTRSVLFFGTQGIGIPCYGLGTSDKALDLTLDSQGITYCYDPANSYKGGHAYPYKPWVWAYDANDLLLVKNGKKNPWDIKPYAVWNMDSVFTKSILNGAAYDSKTGRIFITEGFADGSQPLIHVFMVGTSQQPISTASPSITPTYSPTSTLMMTPTPTPRESNTVPFPRTSKLVRAGNTPPVYYITDKGFKRHIPNEQIFLSYGNRWADVAVLTLAQVDAIPNVILIQSLPDNRVFKLENGTKRWITSVDVFNRNGFKWDQIAPVNATELKYYPIGLNIN